MIVAQRVAYDAIRRHFREETVFCNGVHRIHEPWEEIHLTKEERKGKTFEEMQTLRKIKWGRDERGAPQTELFPEAQEDK